MWTIPPEYLGPYLTSNAIALALVLIAWFWPRVARYSFALIFLAASIANSLVVLKDPAGYLEYGQLTFSALYRTFIDGFFSRHTIPIVLSIATGQLCISLLLAFGRRLWLLGAFGAMVFLLAISPLGVGSAFPCTIVAAIAVVLIIRRSARRQS